MEKTVLFTPNQKATASDFSEMGVFARQSLDHVVFDGITNGKGYTGFNVVKTAQTKVTVGSGRLFNNGAAYFRDDEGGVEIDFLNDLPIAAKAWAAIVVYGVQQDTTNESREFLLNANTREVEGRAIPTESWRVAQVGKLVGTAAPSPDKPSVEATYLVVGWALLSSTSVESVEMNEDTRLRSARDAWDQSQLNKTALDQLAPRLATFEGDITRLAAGLKSSASHDALIRLMEDMARVKEIVSLPATYVDYGSDRLLTTANSDTAASGYSAQVMDGLKFPNADSSGPGGTSLVLANPADANLKTHGGTLVLPEYELLRWREIGGPAGEMALNSFNFDNNSITVSNLSRVRQRMGSPFMVSSSSAWWGTAAYTDPAAGTLTKNGETFQALPTNQYDADGHQMYRVQQIWIDYMSSPYWTRTSAAASTVAGYPWVQSFLCAQDMWVGGLSVPFSRLDSSGPVTLGLCEIQEDGTPDFGKMLNMTTIPYNQLSTNLAGPSPKYDFPPTFLKSGRYYGFVIITAANHWIYVADSGQHITGTMFFKNSGNYWQSEPAKNALIQLYICNFKRPRTEITFEPLTLSGGISAIDILAESAIPESTSITWQVQVAGVWKEFDPSLASPLATLPTLVGLKAILNGTKGMQPAINLTGARVIVSRPATALKHFGLARTLPAAVTVVHMTARLEKFNAADGHTCSLKIKSGGTEYTPSATKDTVIAPGVIERKSVFSIPSTTSYQRVVIAGATNVEKQFVISEVLDVGVS